MGVADLTGALAKLSRAEEHLRAMENEIRAFSLKDAKTIRITFESKDGWCIASADPVPAVPLRVALIVGDGLNNIRAALDYLVWQIVLREGHKPQKTNCFPIYSNKRLFKKEVRKASEEGGRPSPLRGLKVDGDAWTLIEQAQPFNGPEPKEDNPLLLLADMTNFDKHRTLLVQRSWLDQQGLIDSFQFGPDFDPIRKKFALTATLSPEHPTEIARFRFRPGVTPRVYMKGQLRVHPSVGDGETQVPLTRLFPILIHARELIEKFAALPRVQT